MGSDEWAEKFSAHPSGNSPQENVKQYVSAQADETVQSSHTELEPAQRNTLVHPVEHAGEVQLRGQLQRHEPVVPNTQPGKTLGVLTSRKAVRNGLGPRVLRLQRLRHRVHQPPVEGGLHSGQVVDELPAHLRPEQLIDLGEVLLLGPRQETPVD